MQIDWSLWNWALPWEVHRTDPHPGQCPCNSWEKGTLTLPSVEKGNRFQDLSQGAYHSTGHLVSVSAWNRPTVHWHSLKNCIYPHVMPSELPHTNSPSLNCFQAFCHLLLQAWPQWSLLHITCWSLQSSELKKKCQSTNWNEFKPHVTMSCSLYASLTSAQTHCTCHRYFVNTISSII